MVKTKDYVKFIVLQLLLSLVIIHSFAYPTTFLNLFETLSLQILLVYFFPRLWTGYMVLTSIAVLLYYPTGVKYDSFNFATAAALLSTNKEESLEYIRSIDWSTILMAIVFASSILMLSKFIRRVELPKPNKKIGAAFLITFSLFLLSLCEEEYDNTNIESDIDIEVFPIKFLANAFIITHKYNNEFQKIKSEINKPINFKIDQVEQKYKTYVLVIGESVRADALHLYGFKFNNTPFLDKKANYIMENMYSPAAFTQLSLRHALSLHKNNSYETSMRENVVTLAEKANMNTYWLSNQGTIGRHDSLVSTIAYQANKVVFLKKGSYNSTNTFDDELVQPFIQVLNDNTNKQNKLIVLHLMGSHWDFCARLRHTAYHYVNNNKKNCYIDTIKETDKFLSQIYSELEKTNQPFSILYFADHGLSYELKELNHSDTNFPLQHDDKYIQNYHVPFIIINSDQTTQIRNPAQRSGFEILGGLASWLGISSQQLENSDNFFNNKDSENIRVFDLDSNFKSLESLDDNPLPPELL